MISQLPTHITVKYSKPHAYDRTHVPNVVWSYHIDTANGEVYGFAGGLLSKTSEGLWQVHYWEHAVGSPAKTREQAILNVLPLAAKIVQDRRTQQQDYEKVYDARQALAQVLSSQFSSRPDRSVSVWDITANRDKPSAPARFKLTLVYDDLTAEQVEWLAKQGN